jgi:hypothetical protein
MSTRKINLGGQEFEAEEISFQPDFENGGEQWSTYTLLDGTTLKVKSVLINVLRVAGMFAPNGDPLYQVNASLIVATNAPESLRRKS